MDLQALKKQFADATGGPEPIPGSNILDSMKILLDRFSWQPIETAPKDGTPILAYEPTPGSPTEEDGRYYITTGYRVRNQYRTGTEHENPTHWMPLPEPPKEEDNKA